MSDLLERIQVVKQRWTVPELVEALTGEPVPHSRKIHSFTNEADNTPSLHLYDDSWYDYSTGKYGDVVDLVCTVKRCTVERAVQILEEEADELGLVQTVRTAAPRPVFVSPDWITMYDGSATTWTPPTIEGVSPKLLANLWWSYRIGTAYKALAIYHFNADAEVIGIKYRSPTGKKTSEPGSDFSSYLYQPFDYQISRALLAPSYAHDTRPTLAGPVEPNFCVITEGETDSWAWLSVRPDDHVYALPSGAQSWKDRFLEQLEGYDKVYLAFDHDTAGVAARDKVTRAVGWGRAEHVQFPTNYKDIREAVAAGWVPKL